MAENNRAKFLRLVRELDPEGDNRSEVLADMAGALAVLSVDLAFSFSKRSESINESVQNVGNFFIGACREEVMRQMGGEPTASMEVH